MKERRNANRAYAIGKLGGKCVNCGATEHLQFDHIKTRREHGGSIVANMLAHGRSRLDKELERCQLLCRDCHRDKTMNDMKWKDSKTEHGTPRSYLHCKCTICRTAHNNSVNQYRWSHGLRKQRIPR